MKSRFYIWLSLVAGLLATSCNDAFMDRQPHTEIGADSYFNTEEDLKMYCYGFYHTKEHPKNASPFPYKRLSFLPMCLHIIRE